MVLVVFDLFEVFFYELRELFLWMEGPAFSKLGLSVSLLKGL
ncbi:hypothetical protein QFZ87_000898 [Bacillus sp. SLBN-46]|nr:hypothetical protein [Bacillus sp. SLBN-46]